MKHSWGTLEKGRIRGTFLRDWKELTEKVGGIWMERE